MSSLPIEKWNPDKDGVLNEENLRHKLEKYGFTCTKFTFTAGTDFPDHTHDVDKKDALLSGKFRFGRYLDPGDIIDVPRDTVHSAKAIGEEDAVVFDSEPSK